MSSLSLSLPPPSSRVLDHVKFLRIQCQRLANILELENDQELKQIYVARVHGLFDSIYNLEADASHWLWSWVKPGLRTAIIIVAILIGFHLLNSQPGNCLVSRSVCFLTPLGILDSKNENLVKKYPAVVELPWSTSLKLQDHLYTLHRRWHQVLTNISQCLPMSVGLGYERT
jgi:hypothetical protein